MSRMTVASWIVAAVPAALTLLPSLLLRTRPVIGWWGVCFASAWLAAFALVKWDPAGFLNWLFD